MPCYDPPEIVQAHRKIEAEQKVTGLLELIEQKDAIICGILRACGNRYDSNEIDEILHSVDWPEVGIPKQTFLDWWDEHQEKDKIRRELDKAKQLLRANGYKVSKM